MSEFQYICRNVRIFVGILCSALEYAIHGPKMSEQNRSINIVSRFVKLTKMGSLVAVLTLEGCLYEQAIKIMSVTIWFEVWLRYSLQRFLAVT